MPILKISKGGQTRERILDAAQAIASREGLEGLTIGGIAERLAMSKSGVFAHFGSREEMQIAVIDDYARRFLDAVFFPALKKPRGLPRLQAMFENWLDRCVFVEIPHGCVFISGAVEFDDKEGPVRDRMVAVTRAWQGEMQQAARQAADEGHLRQDSDAEQIVFDLYGILLSLHHDARLLRDARAVARARTSFERVIGHCRIQTARAQAAQGTQTNQTAPIAQSARVAQAAQPTALAQSAHITRTTRHARATAPRSARRTAV